MELLLALIFPLLREKFSIAMPARCAPKEPVQDIVILLLNFSLRERKSPVQFVKFRNFVTVSNFNLRLFRTRSDFSLLFIFFFFLIILKAPKVIIFGASIFAYSTRYIIKIKIIVYVRFLYLRLFRSIRILGLVSAQIFYLIPMFREHFTLFDQRTA